MNDYTEEFKPMVADLPVEIERVSAEDLGPGCGYKLHVNCFIAERAYPFSVTLHHLDDRHTAFWGAKNAIKNIIRITGSFKKVN